MPRSTGANPTRVLAFGPFRLFPDRGLLLEGDAPVQIGSRALDILVALVERAGEVVTKKELIDRAWPSTTVVEANLRVHIAGLRKVLGGGGGGGGEGAGYIAGVTGRGYRFVAPVAIRLEPEGGSATMPAAGQRSNLPARLTRMVGRDDIVADLSGRLPHSRFITIVGTGGIGKTSVALAVAEKMAMAYRDGARLVDFTPVMNPLAVPAALSSVLGTTVTTEDAVPNLIAFLRDRNMLLVLDNCEHVVTAAATLAEQILRAAPQVNVLATSREPLDADGEVVQRLAPLALLPRGSKPTSAAALAFSSVQLFVDRVSANVDGFKMTDEHAPEISEICATLDGLPLAIELAASRVEAFGVRGLAALLGDRFKLRMPGRRTGPPRHQTLSTMLDWSHDQLADDERTALRRMAVFASRFSLASANVVASALEPAASDIVDPLARLVRKSLVVADTAGGLPKYRLLSTTRAYALQKLADSGELELISRRYAEHCEHMIGVAVDELQHQSAEEWLGSHAELIDDVRSALAWAFSAKGDADLGIALTIATVPFWTLLSLNQECRMSVETALSSLDSIGREGTDDKLPLLAALGGALWYTRGSVSTMTAAWHNALVIAEGMGNIEYQLRSLLGLWAGTIQLGENRASLALAERFERVAANSDDAADSLIADRMIGYTRYLLGELGSARIRVEHMLDGYGTAANPSHIVRFHFDQRVLARIPLANILWLQGFPEQAMRVIETNIGEAIEIGHGLSLSYALAKSACPVALLAGDLDAAERFLTLLLEHPGRQDSVSWELWGNCIKGVLLLKQGALADGVRILGAALGKFPEDAFHLDHLAFLGALAEGWASTGDVAAGLSAINQALDVCRRHEENWCVAELLRIKGEVVLKAGKAGASAGAQDCFHEAIDWARRQGALSWELRATTSLARLLHHEGQTSDAYGLLNTSYDRFTEGFSTSDLISARALLNTLR